MYLPNFAHKGIRRPLLPAYPAARPDRPHHHDHCPGVPSPRPAAVHCVRLCAGRPGADRLRAAAARAERARPRPGRAGHEHVARLHGPDVGALLDDRPGRADGAESFRVSTGGRPVRCAAHRSDHAGSGIFQRLCGELCAGDGLRDDGDDATTSGRRRRQVQRDFMRYRIYTRRTNHIHRILV